MPEREFEETEHKAAAMRRAIEQAAEAMDAPIRSADGQATNGPVWEGPPVGSRNRARRHAGSQQGAWGGHDMKQQPPPRMRPGRTALLASAASAALAATALTGAPASATLSGPGVTAGHNITVFHNIDFVAVFGWGLGDTLTVTVERDGVLIGTATGAAVDTPEGPGLEVNHGPEGAPLPGDCWEGHTPDIRPGDVVSVTDGAVTDQVTVDNIAFTGQPSELGQVPCASVPERRPRASRRASNR